MRGFKTSYYIPIEIEKLSCPKCTSKDLEVIGYRTIRCKKCGFIFSIGGAIYYGWFPWVFFWPLWFPIIFFKEK
jgi:DNA-directed RNA polymerase subunit RPC12/RpoP